MKAKIHSMVSVSEVNGPGKRAVIWFQGCHGMNCRGCWNPETHAFQDAGEFISDSKLLAFIFQAYRAFRIEGVTFSGGEPMQQPDALFGLIDLVKEKIPWLSIGMFTGYTEKELAAGRYVSLMTSGYLGHEYNRLRYQNGWRAIRNRLDWAIMGRYNKQLPAAGDAMTTSGNQMIQLFSARYTLDDFPKRTMEVTIDPEALVTVTGFPTNGSIGG